MAFEELAEVVLFDLEFSLVGHVLVTAAGADGGAWGVGGFVFGDR